MILNVEYEIGNSIVKKTFKGDDIARMFEKARECKEYKDCHTATFEVEEVDENGDKCGKC